MLTAHENIANISPIELRLNHLGEVTLVYSYIKGKFETEKRILVTNMSLSHAKILAFYQRRWCIEILFKELKSEFYARCNRAKPVWFCVQISPKASTGKVYASLRFMKPATVKEYNLSPLGQVLREPLMALAQWAVDHQNDITMARENYLRQQERTPWLKEKT